MVNGKQIGTSVE